MVCHAKVRQHYQTAHSLRRASASNTRSRSSVARTAAAIGVTAKRRRRGLDRPHEQVGDTARCAGFEDERDPRDVRRGLLEHLQPFRSDRELEAGEAGEIAARMRQVRHEALADRVGHVREHDRHRPGSAPAARPVHRRCRWPRSGRAPGATSSAAWLRNAFSPPPAQRYSIQRLRPLTHPSSRKPVFERGARATAPPGRWRSRPINTPMRRTLGPAAPAPPAATRPLRRRATR